MCRFIRRHVRLEALVRAMPVLGWRYRRWLWNMAIARFPSGYEDRMSKMHDFEDACGPMPAHRHVNGGGWVADTACVDPSAWVYGNTQVYARRPAFLTRIKHTHGDTEHGRRYRAVVAFVDTLAARLDSTTGETVATETVQ